MMGLSKVSHFHNFYNSGTLGTPKWYICIISYNNYCKIQSLLLFSAFLSKFEF